MPISITTGGVIMTGGKTILGAGDVAPLSSRGVPVDGVDGVASQGTLTIAEALTDGDQMTIGLIQYTFLDTTVSAFDIAIGANEAATKVNIVAAINLSGTEGVEYHAGTQQNTLVAATAFATDDCVLTARATGVAGDSIDTIETGQELTDVANVFDADTLGTTTSGVDDVDGAYENNISAGGFVYDHTNENMYENTGTQAKPAYTKINA